jgi:hypothetical protein
MKTESQYNAARDQLSLVLSFFSRVESKLSFLFAVDTGMLAVLVADAPRIKDLSWSMIVAAGLTLLLVGGSIVFLYRGAFPNLKGGEGSLVYFREVASRTEHRFIEDFKNQSEEEHINDLLGQAWRNSIILRIKFDSLKAGFWLLAAGIIPWLVSLALFAANGSPARSTLLR